MLLTCAESLRDRCSSNIPFSVSAQEQWNLERYRVKTYGSIIISTDNTVVAAFGIALSSRGLNATEIMARKT
jgi:hypothetical protein